jgi:hypothetical protein
VGPDGIDHAAGDGTFRGGLDLPAYGLAKEGKLGDEASQEADEGVRGLSVGLRHLARLAPGLQHDVDRPFLQVQAAAAGEETDVGDRG